MIKFNIFTNLINKILSTKQQRPLLSSIKIGDLIWAQMPLKNKELKAIEESHRTRPYLVMWKDSANIYAYQASSKESRALNNYEKYCINKLRYRKSKDTWLELNKINKVPINNLKNKFYSLNLMDLKAIEKRLEIQKNRGKKIEHTFKKDIHISEGDAVLTNNFKYYIYTSDNAYLYAFKILNKDKTLKNYKVITINKKRYFADIKNKVALKRNSVLKIIDIATDNEKNIINNIKSVSKSNNVSKYNIEKKQKVKYELGTVFQAGKSKIVYLFESKGVYYGVDTLMYQMFPRVLQIHNIQEKQIIDIYDMEKCKQIVEVLLLKCAKPYSKIEKLYREVIERLNA